MGKKVDVFKKIEVDPNTTTEELIYTVPDARVLKLARVKIFFDYNNAYQLEIKVLWGNKEVRPTDGSYVGSGNWVISESDEVYQSGQQIKVKATNTSTTETKIACIHLEGVLE